MQANQRAQRREDLRNATISLLLEVRRAYLATGASALDHWQQIQSRTRRAAKSSTTVEEWFSTLSRGLRLPSAGSSLSSELESLRSIVGDDAAEWLRMLEDETAALLARTRALADAQRAAKEETKDIDEAREAAEPTAEKKTTTRRKK